VFTNVFATPYFPQSLGILGIGGYPQSPSKGALPLCTPQLLYDLNPKPKRAFRKPFQPPVSTSLGGFLRCGGHPQTPGRKHPAPLLHPLNPPVLGGFIPLSLISPARGEKILGEATSPLQEHNAVRATYVCRIQLRCSVCNLLQNTAVGLPDIKPGTA
jgi:hypothetical protein